jgi:hypothetical protein
MTIDADTPPDVDERCLFPRPERGARYSASDVALILSTVMERQGTLGEDLRVYTLKEVAELTHFSHRVLEHLCRQDVIEHVRLGRKRGMTARQIGVLILRFSQGGDDLADLREPGTAQDQIRRNILKNLNRGRGLNASDLEQAREASRPNARRSPTRRQA